MPARGADKKQRKFRAVWSGSDRCDRGKIGQFAEDAVAQLLVEAWRLEGKGIQEDIFHAAPAGFLLRAEEQLFPIPLPAQVLADVHEADGQPAVVGIADEPAESSPGFIPKKLYRAAWRHRCQRGQG